MVVDERVLWVTQASREPNWRQFLQVTLRLLHATFPAPCQWLSDSWFSAVSYACQWPCRCNATLEDCVTTLFSRMTQLTFYSFCFFVKLRKWLLSHGGIVTWMSRRSKNVPFLKTQDVSPLFHPFRLKLWRYYPRNFFCASDCYQRRRRLPSRDLNF